MKRLDVMLFEMGLFATREKAKEAIQENIIEVNGKICNKPGIKLDDNISIKIVGQKLKYVSRAGLKLEEAQKKWNINFKDKVVLDVGASTGGFTDFAIQNGAAKVYAVDVGTSQLDDKLKQNPKVVNMEQTDFRTMPNLPDKIDIAVCDCSFISLKLLANKFNEVLESGAKLVVLIKPQFECGKEIASKFKGVIKDEKLQENIKKEIINYYQNNNFNFVDSCTSPIRGTAGNKEFLAYFIKNN